MIIAFMFSFYILVLILHLTDRNLMLAASLLAAADLWSFSPSEVSVEMMLEKNQVLAAVGTLCYMSEVTIKYVF